MTYELFLEPEEYFSLCVSGFDEPEEKAKERYVIYKSDLPNDFNEDSPLAGIIFHEYFELPNGAKHGKEIIWFDEEQKNYETMWKDGKQISHTVWYKNGQVCEERNFETGERSNWDDEGNMYETCCGKGHCLGNAFPMHHPQGGIIKRYDCDHNCGLTICVRCHCYHPEWRLTYGFCDGCLPFRVKGLIRRGKFGKSMRTYFWERKDVFWTHADFQKQ